MKYTKEERLAIGRRIYDKDLSFSAAANEYNIGYYTARDYYREYKASIQTPFTQCHDLDKSNQLVSSVSSYENMTKEELIDELLKAKISEARAKKGYEVKGAGASKEFIPINAKNLK